MCAGALYRPGDTELVADRTRSQELQRQYNATIVGESDRRQPIVAAWLGSAGAHTAIRAPFYADYG